LATIDVFMRFGWDADESALSSAQAEFRQLQIGRT
jgi:hypothetical protein